MQAAGTIDYSEEHHMYAGTTASSDRHDRARRPRCRCWGRDPGPYSSLRVCMSTTAATARRRRSTLSTSLSATHEAFVGPSQSAVGLGRARPFVPPAVPAAHWFVKPLAVHAVPLDSGARDLRSARDA